MTRGLLFLLLVPPCGAADKGADLEYVRKVNLEHAAMLPDFVADEIADRSQSHAANPPDWQPMDHVEAEIVVRSKGEFTRRNVRLNGQPWDKPFPRWNWGVAFGDELISLFDPKCKNAIELEGPAELQGEAVIAYHYQAPQNGCFGYWTKSGLLTSKKVNPPRRGRFVVDRATGNLLRFEMQAVDFPKNFGYDTWTVASAWDEVRIGSEAYLLPVAMEMVTGSTGHELGRTLVEYKNHRHFEASTSVQFK